MDRRSLGVIALACLIQSVWCQLDPEIVDEILPEVMSQGGSARLNCTVVNKQDGHTVIWTFMNSRSGGEIITNDENIFIDNPQCKEGSRKYEIVRRETNQRITYMLIVNCLELVDHGYYKCYIQIRGVGSGSWPSKIGYLVVQVPPTITSKKDAVMQFYVGQAAQLDCTATGQPRPNITWVRSDGSILPGGAALLRNTTLKIEKISKQDRGLYKCIADNQVRPPDVYLVSLNVFFKPETIAVNDIVGQAQNRLFDAKLECRVSGYPEPKLTWFRETTKNDGNQHLEQLNDNEKYDISKQIANTTLRFGESWHTLRIKNVEANDYTKYYCVAKNRIGVNDTTMIILFETMECQGANCPSFDSQGASAISSTETVECQGANCPSFDSQGASAISSTETVECQGANCPSFDSQGASAISSTETVECQGANCPSFDSQGASAISMSLLTVVVMIIIAKVFSRH